jgi:membrane-bound ClpP family serine protease
MKNQNNNREELEYKFIDYIANANLINGIDGVKIARECSKIAVSYTQKKVEEVKKDLIEKALNIFEKHKDEPMTGNVVILELKNLQSLKEKV